MPASHEKASSAGHIDKKEGNKEASSGALGKGGGKSPSEGEQVRFPMGNLLCFGVGWWGGERMEG